MKNTIQQALRAPREGGVTMQNLAGSRIGLLVASFLALCTSCAEKPSRTVMTKDPVKVTVPQPENPPSQPREKFPYVDRALPPEPKTPGERHHAYMRSLREHIYGGEVSMGGKIDEGGRTAIMKAEFEFYWRSAQEDIARGEPTKALSHLGHIALFTFTQADTVSHPAFRSELEEKFQRARAEIVRVYGTLSEKDHRVWADSITAYTQSEHIPEYEGQENSAANDEGIRPEIPGKAHCEKDRLRLDDEEGGGGGGPA